jgi:glutaminyl-peptide cyclotransferase
MIFSQKRWRLAGFALCFTLLLISVLIGSNLATRAQNSAQTATVSATVQPIITSTPAAATPVTTATIRPQAATGVERFSGASAFEFAAAQVAFGVRPTGSEANRKMGDYVLSTLQSYGWKISEQPLDIDVNGTIIKGRNLIASIGSGPLIIFGAHYDTRLWSDNDPDESKRRDPTPGANDGASGVAVLMELGRVLGKGYAFNNEIRLVFFDAEDNGNIPGWNIFSIGTYEYVEALDKRPEYVVIVDMVADANLNIHYEGRSMQSAPEIMTGIWRVAATLGYTAFIPSQKFTMIDDHIPFIDAGIKAIDIIDFDYPEWHTVSDKLDKISAQSLEQVGRTLQVWLEQTGVVRVIG